MVVHFIALHFVPMGAHLVYIGFRGLGFRVDKNIIYFVDEFVNPIKHGVSFIGCEGLK